MSRLAHMRRIWAAAVAGDADQLSPAMRRMSIAASVLAVPVGAGIGVFMLKDVLMGILAGAGYPLAFIALVFWTVFMSGAATQNHPANAWLVPRLNRQIRETTVLAWLLTMAPLAAIAATRPDGALFLLLASVGVTAFGMFRAGLEPAIYPALAIFMVFTMGVDLKPYAHWLQMPALLAAGCLGSLAFAAYGLAASFPRGGERHWSMLEKQADAMVLDTMENIGRLLRSGSARRPLYGYLLKRDTSVGSLRRHLLLHVLGPGSSRTLMLLPLIVLVLLAPLLKPGLVAAGVAPAEMLRIAVTIIAGATLTLVLSWFRFVLSMANTQGEQAVARLAPGMPGTHQLNRELGRQILRVCLGEWLLLTVLAFSLVALWGGADKTFMATAAFMSAVPVMAGVALRDYARRKLHTYGTQALAFAWVLLLALISLAFVDNLPAWTAMLLLIQVSAIAIVAARWRMMVAAPVAFPATRFD